MKEALFHVLRVTSSSGCSNVFTVYWTKQVESEDNTGKAAYILYLGTRWKCPVSPTLRSFYPRVSGTHWVAGWMGPLVILDNLEKIKIFVSFRESNDDSSVVQPLV